MKRGKQILIKIALGLLLGLVCITCLGGCSMDSNGQILFFPEKEYQGTVEEVKQEMIDYVHNKYPDLEFRVLSFEPRQFAHSNYEIMWVAPDATNPDIYFSVYRYSKKDIRDRYIYLLMSGILQDRIQKITDQVFPGAKCTLSCGSERFPPQDFRPDMDPERFIQWGFSNWSYGTCTLYICDSSYEQVDQIALAKLKEQLVALAPRGILAITGLSQEDLSNVRTGKTMGRHANELTTGEPICTKELFSKSIYWHEDGSWEE